MPWPPPPGYLLGFPQQPDPGPVELWLTDWASGQPLTYPEEPAQNLRPGKDCVVKFNRSKPGKKPLNFNSLPFNLNSISTHLSSDISSHKRS